jgi:hypothetical protein
VLEWQSLLETDLVFRGTVEPTARTAVGFLFDATVFLSLNSAPRKATTLALALGTPSSFEDAEQEAKE